MNELSRRSGVPIATIKFYQREKLLHPGKAAGATRAHYDETHVSRLRLIRTLVDVAGMSLDRVRDVIAVVDDDAVPVAQSIGYAHAMLSSPPNSTPSPAARATVAQLIADRAWTLDSTSHSTALAAALDTMEHAGQPLPPASLAAYAEAAEQIARVDLEALGTHRDSADATAYAVIGTLLPEPAIIALRRMAQEALTR